MHATNFCFILLLEFCIHCQALPIFMPGTIGERNVIICGILAVISLATLVGACAFCRRRQKQFEKFENETTSCDSRPEFPIFRALNSPEQNSRQPAVIVPAHSPNQSQDNLLEPDANDNNNGPLSTADLENIENNNAIDYIVTTTESNCGASSSHSHQNLLSCVPAELVNERGVISATNFDGILLSPSPPCDGIETNSSLTSVSIFMSSDMDIDNINSNNNYKIDSEPPLPQQHQSFPHHHQQQQQINYNNSQPGQTNNTFEDNFVFSIDDPSIDGADVDDEDDYRSEEPQRWSDVEPSNPFLDGPAQQAADVRDANATVVVEECRRVVVEHQWAEKAPLEHCLSPESITSKTSNEFNSVEEALRCLDNAISFGDTLDSDNYDEEDYAVDDDAEDSAAAAALEENVNDMSIAKALEHYLLDGVTNSQMDSHPEGGQIAEEMTEEVRAEAIALVDDVLAESRRRVEARLEIEATKVVAYSHDDMVATQQWLEQTVDYRGSATITDLDGCDSMDVLPNADDELDRSDNNLMFGDLPTSTPFHTRLPPPPPYPSDKARDRKVVVNLFDTESNANDGTFVVSPPQPNDATYTFDDPEAKVGATPVIKIDREDTNSEDLTTQTPLNTPCELNYNLETWDKLVQKKQYAVDDIAVGNKTQTLDDSTGWFLHPQNRAAKFNNDTFDVTEQQFTDFAGDEDDEQGGEDMNATFDQLRKQLAEMLPHAQGMGGQFDNYEEPKPGGSDDPQQPPHPHVEETTNILDGLAGLIINDVGAGIDADANANEMFINYKRPLSPIQEESEEDMTCKTFVLTNETRMLESTSTEPCVEEAIMGVPKALMASNDTLFNFEDTLGDGDTLSASCSPRPVQPRPVAEPVRPTSFGFEMPPPPPPLCESVDVLSPDQPKTENFSQEHELTYTMEEKTCISVHDDEMISEISEPDMLSLSSGFDRANLSSLNQDDSTFVSETCARNDATLEGTSGRVNESSTSIESMVMSPRDNSRINGNEMDLSVAMEECEVDGGGVGMCDMDETIGTIADSRCMVEIKDLSSSSSEIENINNGPFTPSDSPINNVDASPPSPPPPDNPEEDSDSLKKSITAPNPDDDLMRCSQQSDQLLHHSSGSDDNDSNKENQSHQPPVAYNKLKMIDFLNSEIQYSSSQYNAEHNRSKSSNSSNNNSGSYAKSADTMSSVDSGVATLDSIDDSQVMMMSHTMWSGESGDDGDIIYKDSKNHHTYDYGFDLHPNANNKHNLNNLTIHDIDFDDQECGLMIADKIMIGQYLSGEEDPWVADDVQLAKMVSDNMLMSTSFNNVVPEWDSDDDDDTNSSEEFMYVKGCNLPDAGDVKEEQSVEKTPTANTKETKPERMTDAESQRMWMVHTDKVPVVSGKDTPDEVPSEVDESSSENEGEFVPSCWDSMAQPQRSALKSPDKSNEKKRKRNVAFKIKRYHSVYEYPRETVELSPAYSEPDLWTGNDYGHHMNYLSSFADEFKEQIDGFNITSSARPFHGSQFHAQCNTWPTDSDFSWSQYESNDLHQNANPDSVKSSDTPSIVWSRDLTQQDGDENSSSRSPTTESEFPRPDSGVGESAELLSESPSLGDLCHAKNTLRLSLNLSPGTEPPSHTEAEDSTASLPIITQIIFGNVDEDVAHDTIAADPSKLFDTILPTPSCTGSMDSLSSSSGSSDHRPPSFTTFGKKLNNSLLAGTAVNSSVSDSDYGSMKIPSIVLIEDCEPQSDDGLLVVTKKYGGGNKLNRSTAARLSDSTDEDSGIENMTRLTNK